jgi:hypothetical protein
MTAALERFRMIAVLSHPVLLVVVLGVVVLLGLIVRSMWRSRRIDFIHQTAIGAEGKDAASELFDRVVPVLVEAGYRMIADAGHTTVFEYRSSLVGPIVISVLLFPIGLIALLARSRETVTFVTAGATLEIYGYCSKPIVDYLVAVADDVAGQRHHVH